MAYTTIDDPSAHFQVNAYSGASNPQTITNGGNSDLQPDFLWSKRRDSSAPHYLFDSTRGVNSSLSSDDADAEDTATGYLASFNSDGFTTGSDSALAYSGRTYVAWQWKANGGSTSSNSSGSITSTVQANTTAGFSIVKYTGNGTQGATIGHGLGVVPNVVLVKGISIGDSWTMLHTGIASDFQTDMLKLDEDVAVTDNNVFWNDTAPTSSVFTVDGSGGETKVNANTYNYIAYCFADIQGYSKFGSYTGNNNTNGSFIYTGFKPAWVMIKEVAASGSWHMFDNKRTPGNLANKFLYADLTDAEGTGSPGNSIDMYSNGFKCRGTGNDTNGDGNKYIYLAFAEHPFVSSKGVPVTAR